MNEITGRVNEQYDRVDSYIGLKRENEKLRRQNERLLNSLKQNFEGMMPFGVASGVVLSNQTDPAILARQIVTNGGVLFYAHPEEPRDWNLPELTGLEIYNIHTDFKRQKGGIAGGVRTKLPDMLLNSRRYPDHVFRLAFHRPTEFLQRWDDLNRTRHITGIAGNDCHQNVGVRAFYTAADTVRIEDTSPKTLKELKLNWFTRPIVRWFCGPLDPDRKLFHVQLDPYERSARFVNTHVLELLKDSLER